MILRSLSSNYTGGLIIVNIVFEYRDEKWIGKVGYTSSSRFNHKNNVTEKMNNENEKLIKNNVIDLDIVVLSVLDLLYWSLPPTDHMGRHTPVATDGSPSPQPYPQARRNLKTKQECIQFNFNI